MKDFTGTEKTEDEENFGRILQLSLKIETGTSIHMV